MKYKKYFLYGFWQKNDCDTFYIYGIEFKKALRLLIIGVTPILLALISICFKATQFMYLFTILSLVIMHRVSYRLGNLKMWFSYNRNDRKVNSIYKGDDIPSVINYETRPVKKRRFIEISGFEDNI